MENRRRQGTGKLGFRRSASPPSLDGWAAGSGLMRPSCPCFDHLTSLTRPFFSGQERRWGSAIRNDWPPWEASKGAEIEFGVGFLTYRTRPWMTRQWIEPA